MFLVAFLPLKQAKIEGKLCASFGKASWRSITWRIRALEHFKTPCQTWKGVGKAISSKMEGNKAFRKAKSSNSQGVTKFARCAKIWQGVPNFRRVWQTFVGCAKISQGVQNSLYAHQPSRFFSRIVIFPFYSFCNR